MAIWTLSVCAIVLIAFIFARRFGLPTLLVLQESSAPTSGAETVLTHPSANASQEEKNVYFDLVRNHAQTADALVLKSGCTPVPLVISLQLKKTFVIKNSDTVNHTIVFNKDHIYAVAAGTYKEVTADFGSIGAGIYQYGCDGSSEAVGIVLVSQ